MNKSLLLVWCVLCPLAWSQGSTFAGPSALAQGAGTIGQRSGQDVEMKYFANASAIRDSGLTPYAVTSVGTLVQPGSLTGIEAGIGLYGRHRFRRSALGVDYGGNFRHYAGAANYDGSNQGLNLEYTYQKSRRMLLDFSSSIGTQSFGTAIGAVAGIETVVDSSSLLFDNRTSYLQVALTTRYALSSRTVISMGGNEYSVHRQSNALVGVRGYALQGSISRQVSRSASVGMSYQHMHFDFPRAFGETDVNSYQGNWTANFGRRWKVGISAGAFSSAVQGVQNTALDPSIAALLGIGTVRTIFYVENVLPIGSASLTRSFRRSSLSGAYSRAVSPGNGVYLTSRQEGYGLTYSYTGIRKLGLSATAGTFKLASLGQQLHPYRQNMASVNFSYNMGHGLNLAATYARRFQDFQASAAFPRDSSRMSVSIYFSPGTIPISFR